MQNICSFLHCMCVYLCVYDLFHALLSLWKTLDVWNVIKYVCFYVYRYIIEENSVSIGSIL
jgi:kynureninase